MSEIGFHIKEAGELSDDEFNALRRHYLVYAWAERDERRNLHRDLDAIYTEIDGLVAKGGLLPIVNSLNTCGNIVVFSTESSTLALREFQQAMLVEDKTVHLVAENSPSTRMLDTLTPNDLLVVVTTSNGFARRQRGAIERCRAYKAIVTASEDAELHAIFDDVLAIGRDASEGSSLHRIYATFGVTYFFDRLFAQYARAFDPLL
ncbi:MAG: hypothetical protein MSA61_04785 [Coriobacteriaceae bacterium]|uniref:hypothetical protein n=1 Tax=Tractidigestivibacter sp. TaxID=2847320 RepID=UPI002A81250A|nr:hypothetical protein [Tractidigestivibacter sp.]MCI7438528.1 hypothetical protein [Coriobacteriaceae bacterium]MDY4533941.1 hypothetical protein [Tractidigestivibacter sp.]MDY5272213.1 hypothetical protein [Tractidigestivibacter sp.]